MFTPKQNLVRLHALGQLTQHLSRNLQIHRYRQNNFSTVTVVQGRAVSSIVGVPVAEGLATDLNVQNGVFRIVFNRPQKANAFSLDMYKSLGNLLSAANKSQQVKYVILAGVGKYFSSGNELENFTNDAKSDKKNIESADGGMADLIRNSIDSFINLEKPLIAFVNGPAIGIGTTLLAHSDRVFCTEDSYFFTPFSQLGICPEAGSSYVFPMTMGLQKATSLLMFNEKLSAEEALQAGLVSKVIPTAKFHEETEKFIEYLIKLPYEALLVSKKLLREPIRQKMLEVNKAEFKFLEYLTKTEDCQRIIQRMLAVKNSKG